MKRNIYLVGMIGAGKSSVGAILADRLEWGFIDTDETVEAIYQQSLAEIIVSYGEKAFRDMESNLLQEVSQGHHQVIACGEGIVLRPQNLKLMKSTGLIFWLDAAVETLRDRAQESRYKPLLSSEETADLRERLLERETLYNQADVHIDTNKISPDDAATAIWKIAFESGEY